MPKQQYQQAIGPNSLMRCCCFLCVTFQVAHCSDISPISKPGTAFKCPEDSEFNPAQALVTEPDQKKCCKVLAMFSFCYIIVLLRK